jgi:hypothetical protein
MLGKAIICRDSAMPAVRPTSIAPFSVVTYFPRLANKIREALMDVRVLRRVQQRARLEVSEDSRAGIMACAFSSRFGMGACS